MRNSIPFLFFGLCLLQFGCSLPNKTSVNQYQPSVSLNTDILPGPGICVLKKFQGTGIDNKFYINWVALSNSNDCIFILEYSINGKDFKPYCLKKGMTSPNDSSPLLYCVVDSSLTNNSVFFRLNAVQENTSINYTEEKKYKTLQSAITIKLNKNKKNSSFNLFPKL